MIRGGTTGYEDLAKGAAKLLFEGRELLVASLDDVIRSKEAAGRQKDIMVLPALGAHLQSGSHRNRK